MLDFLIHLKIKYYLQYIYSFHYKTLHQDEQIKGNLHLTLKI